MERGELGWNFLVTNIKEQQRLISVITAKVFLPRLRKYASLCNRNKTVNWLTNYESITKNKKSKNEFIKNEIHSIYEKPEFELQNKESQEQLTN